MRIFGKAARLGVSAALLVSLTATSAVQAIAYSYGTVVPFNTTPSPTAGVVADSTSYYKLTFGALVKSPDDISVVKVSATNAYFINGTGATDFENRTQVTYPTATITKVPLPPATTVNISADSELWLAASSAATATVTITVTRGTPSATTTDSTTSFTFTTASATVVSTTASTSKLSTLSSDDHVSSIPAASGATTPALYAWTQVKDTANNVLTTGVSVSWQLTGPATFTGGLATETDASASGGYFQSSQILSTGVAGTATLTTTVAYLGKTYTLGSKTIAFSGPMDSIKVVSKVGSIPSDNSNNNISGPFGDTEGKELLATINDAAGLPVSTGGFTYTATVGTNGIIDFPAGQNPAYNATLKGYYLDVDCVAAGSSTLTITATKGTVTKTAAAVTIVCADPLSAAAPGTFTVTAASATVDPGKSINVLVTVKNKAGLAVPDGTEVLAVSNVGAVVTSAGKNTASTVSGVATFIYLAPPAAGIATITAFVDNTDGPHSLNLTVGSGSTGGSSAITIKPSVATIVWGANAVLQVKFAATGEQTFDIEASYDNGPWEPLDGASELTTNAAGSYSHTFKPTETARYRVSFSADGTTVTSPVTKITVRNKITFAPVYAKAKTIKKGASITFTATVRPVFEDGGMVKFTIMKRVSGSWTAFATKTVAANTSTGIAKLAYKFTTAGSFMVRAQAMATDFNAISLASSGSFITVK